MPGHNWELKISERATSHLVSIKANGTRFWGPEQAERYQWRIFEIFELLRRNPEIGVIHPEYGEGVRTFPVERHIVIYDAYWPSVTILAILPPHADFRNEVVLEM